nr:uncharacterized protein LOC112697672 isoform X3 [Arachis hypogaea]
MNSVPVMTTGLTSIEQHAASVYTREVFTDVKKQIVQAAALILISKKRCLNTMVYMVEEYEQPATRIKVAYGRSTGKIDCQCNFWRKNGYPCRHMFFVMKSEHVTTIPDALVLQRWRLNAKAIESYVERWGGTSEAGFLLRHGALHTASHRLFLIGAQKLSLFRKALNGVLTLCRELELEYKAFEDGGGERPISAVQTKEVNCVVRDPAVAKSKGAQKFTKKGHLRKKRLCTIWKRPGHTKRHCMKNIEQQRDCSEEELVEDNGIHQGLNSGSKRRKLVRNVGKSMSHPVESCAGDEDSPARIIGNEPQVLHQMQQFLRQARQNHGLTTGSARASPV